MPPRWRVKLSHIKHTILTSQNKSSIQDCNFPKHSKSTQHTDVANNHRNTAMLNTQPMSYPTLNLENKKEKNFKKNFVLYKTNNQRQREREREGDTDTRTAINRKYVLTLTSACRVIRCHVEGKRKTVTKTQITKLCFVRLLHVFKHKMQFYLPMFPTTVARDTPPWYPDKEGGRGSQIQLHCAVTAYNATCFDFNQQPSSGITKIFI